MKKILLTFLICSGILLAESTHQLQWEGENKNKLTWNEAIEYCDDLSISGKNDWRLPELSELAKYAWEVGHREGSLNNPSYYWSASTYPHFKKAAWFVSFSGVYQHFSIKTNTLYVECVRTK